MEKEEILAHCDHTLLAPTATWDEIREICDDGIRYRTASVCIPPCYVKKAKEYVGDKLTICTVIGFPNGYNTTTVKLLETEEALRDGADEIDMVINIGELKAGNDKAVFEEIRKLKEACGTKILKVIIETCLLTDEEKKLACECAMRAGADFVKTSTGFSTGGATEHDVALMRSVVGDSMGVKASGGVRTPEDAERFIKAGASRLGTSNGVKLLG